VWPAGVLQERLSPQLIGDAQTLERPKPRDPLAPVRVLGFARGAPVAGDEFANAARDHGSL